MSLSLGKVFNRSHFMRVHFLDGYYDIGIFFTTKNHFVLFNARPVASMVDNTNVQIQMFKNLEASKFCQVFLDLHSYKSDKLNIRNQIAKVKDGMEKEINLQYNETITLSKIQLSKDKKVSDFLNIHGYTLPNYPSEYLFLVAERCFISRKDNKKVVRTVAIQISTIDTFDFIEGLYLTSVGKLTPPVIDTHNLPPIKLE